MCPKTIIMRDEDDNFWIAKFVRMYEPSPTSPRVPEYKVKQFWAYHEEDAVKRELE
jgi:hypothetical protein